MVISEFPGTIAADAAKSHIYVPRKESGREPRLNGSLRPSMKKGGCASPIGTWTETRRDVWPLGVYFWGHAWTLLAWCELRDDFRSFRLEQMRELQILEDCFQDVPGKRLIDYFRWMETAHAVPMSDLDPEQ